MEDRIERDSMGEVRVPREALYGAQTQRAVQNFPVSGQPMPLPVRSRRYDDEFWRELLGGGSRKQEAQILKELGYPAKPPKTRGA